MKFRCPFCFLAVNTAPESCGYRVRCPNCGRLVKVAAGRFEPGCIIGDFLIKEKIGEGAYASVYLATQLSLERQVALKVLSPEVTTGKGISKFLKEARAAAKLNHINLVQAYAVGQEDEFYYMAMTCILGETLSARLKREGKIPVDEALHIIQQVAEALCYAWEESGLIHKDIKPDNIMITRDGIVKVTDLGLSVYKDEWEDSDEVSGSPPYMSPEQLTGKALDTRSDIYSMGITLYQMICGHTPFSAASVKEYAAAHLNQPPVPLHKLDPAVPKKVSQFVDKMLAKDPEGRFRNMEELLRNLWSLRQTTAPDSNIVPDVHTLTSTRLDYESQIESAEAKRNVRKLENEVSIHRRNLRILLPLLPILIGGAISFTIYRYESRPPTEKSVERIALDRVSAFERLSRDPTISIDQVQQEGRYIITEFKHTDAKLRRAVLFRVRWLIADARISRLKKENAALQKQLDTFQYADRKWDLFQLLFQDYLKDGMEKEAFACIMREKAEIHSKKYTEWLDRQFILYKEIMAAGKNRKKMTVLQRKYLEAVKQGDYVLASVLQPGNRDLSEVAEIMKQKKLQEVRRIRFRQGKSAAVKKRDESLRLFIHAPDYGKIREEFQAAAD